MNSSNGLEYNLCPFLSESSLSHYFLFPLTPLHIFQLSHPSLFLTFSFIFYPPDSASHLSCSLFLMITNSSHLLPLSARRPPPFDDSDDHVISLLSSFCSSLSKSLITSLPLSHSFSQLLCALFSFLFLSLSVSP